ncbi:hypothetical protein [Dyella mobilis]|uniref:Uncharacterized protein n=1 Tax=Dyella mobilis TaxID=1849582 RepID=A0ABS2KCF0_9GAMM|nr:hypothetical protein [Dyella mobilis]MBM7128789.1 hypothetical protein [Dyella mobilis]GLQ99120.1 hypothetical protein GCM10007863_35400 [Dyella mobilis]
MTIMAMILAFTSASCFDNSIYSVSDLTCPIRYVDKQQGYFIGIEENNAIIGTAFNDVKNPANDMPQVDGPIENCSSRAFRCRSIAELVFAIPKGAEHSAEYSDGPRIVIKRLANGGWHGSAMCSVFTRTGCSPHVDVNKLVEAYQYDVSPAGVVTSIKIQDWNDDEKPLSTRSLVLVSKAGLKLN